MAISGSNTTFYAPRVPHIQSRVTDEALQRWMRIVTEQFNILPNFSVFSYVTPNSNVSASAPALGFNLAPSSVGSTLWVKQSGSNNTGWVALL